MVKVRLLGCMGQFLKGRSQRWDIGAGIKVGFDKELTEVGKMTEGD